VRHKKLFYIGICDHQLDAFCRERHRPVLLVLPVRNVHPVPAPAYRPPAENIHVTRARPSWALKNVQRFPGYRPPAATPAPVHVKGS